MIGDNGYDGERKRKKKRRKIMGTWLESKV